MAEKDSGSGILRTDIYNIRFYEKSPFYGSWRGMHYRIMGVESQEVSGEESAAAGGGGTAAGVAARKLCVTIWPGPYNYETTDDALKVSAMFDFSNEGLDAVTEYLNAYYGEHFA